MRTAASVPFLRPSKDVVVEDGWRLIPDETPLPDRLPHWDPNTTVRIGQSLTIDIDALRDQCQLAEDATFAVTSRWHSSKTRITSVEAVAELGNESGRLSANLEMAVPGPVLGGRLSIYTSVVLRTHGTSTSPIAPARPGSILWDLRESTALEGAAARFPVSVVPFVEVAGIADGAGWSLELALNDLNAPVLGSMRLLLNADDAALVEALRTGSTSRDTAALRMFVHLDVARSLVTRALQCEAFVATPDAWDEDSVGRMLNDLIGQLWPGIPVSKLRLRMLESPAVFESELQSQFWQLGA